MFFNRRYSYYHKSFTTDKYSNDVCLHILHINILHFIHSDSLIDLIILDTSTKIRQQKLQHLTHEIFGLLM